MELRADPGLGRTIGCFAAVLGVVLILVWLWLRPGGGYSAIAGLGLLLTALVCVTYRHEVQIDAEADMVEQSRRVLFWARNRGFLLRDFRAVGVAAVLGGDLRPVYLAHVIELRGRSRLVLPGMHFGLERTRREAAELARELGLPLEQRVRTILF